MKTQLKRKFVSCFITAILFLHIVPVITVYAETSSFFSENLKEIKENILSASSDITLKSFMLDIPMIPMLPNYPTGCEIISIQMMLEGLSVKLDTEKFIDVMPVNDDPRLGLRGNPRIALDDSQRRYAWWIYPEALIAPVESLVHGVKGVDLTGITFDELLRFMVKNKTGVAVFLGRWSELFRYHNVLVVGFDETYIYINEPYDAELVKLTHERFMELWNVTDDAETDRIPHYAPRRAFSIIPNEEQMQSVKYKAVYAVTVVYQPN